MDTIDATVSIQRGRKWRAVYLLWLVLPVCLFAVVFGIGHFAWAESAPSPMCAQIASDLRSRIEHLAPEEKLVAYFAEKHWPVSHDDVRGIYYVRIATKKSDHWVDIHAQIVAGFVADVTVEDRYVSL